MTKEQAISKWTNAATASDKGVRTGNWEPLATAIRHCSGKGDEIQEVSPGVLLVTVAKEEARKPFYLVVE